VTADKKKIELAMARACMNAKDIAVKANMPEATVKNVLSGRNVKPRTLGKVAQALRCDVTELLEVN
jgi:predicted transcriptional regulator